MNATEIIRRWFPRATALRTERGACRRLDRFVGLPGVTATAIELGPNQWLPVAHVTADATHMAATLASNGVCVSNDAEVLAVIEAAEAQLDELLGQAEAEYNYARGK